MTISEEKERHILSTVCLVFVFKNLCLWYMGLIDISD